MSKPTLTIAIPTRNRSAFLAKSMGAFVDELSSLMPEIANRIELIVSDNASEDETPRVVADLQRNYQSLRYQRHGTNVGASRNVNSCVKAANGEFCWVVGDDEIICPDAIQTVLRLLDSPVPPDLLISFDSNYASGLPSGILYPDFRSFATECANRNPHALLEHTLVSSNVFRRNRFDLETAESTLSTDFSHMYAVLASLAALGGQVQIASVPVITVRKDRAPAVDGVWPTNLEASWLRYLHWMKNLFSIDALDPEKVIHNIGTQLLRRILKHPIRFLINNRKALLDPRAAVWIARRLLFHAKTRRT